MGRIINWFGPIGPSGYGRFTRFMIPALESLGHNTNILPIYSSELANPNLENEIAKHINPFDDMILNADIGIRLSIANPSDAVGFNGKKRVIYNMLEVDKIPPFWVKSLNTVDRVWVPSAWMKEVYINSGVKVPISVVPGGVDTSIFNEYRAPIIPKNENDNYRFLFVGKWEYRKGVDVLLKAFSEEFKKGEKVELIVMADSIKQFTPNFNIYKEIVDLNLPQDRAQFKIIEGMIPDYKEMGRLYTSADCFVKPTRGEGWNLPLIEAMSCGLPSITTNWSAHTEFANDKNAYMLNDYELVPAINEKQISQNYLKFGKWANPSIKELREKMRYVFEHQDEAKALGKKASNDMNNWTWKKAAEKATEAIEDAING